MANAMAEKEIQRLRKLPENRICPNCCKKDTTFGFQAVCVAYKTFICSDCKSAHQAFSHRCKSVSMSNWTLVEVQALDEKNGGGNRAAIRQWLAGVPESVRPGPDSHVDVKKAFITRAYDKREWLNSGESDTKTANVASTPSKGASPQQVQQGGVQKQAPVPKPSDSNRNEVASVNLLDDDSFATQGSQPHVSGSVQGANRAAHADCNLLGDAFFSSPAPLKNAIVSNVPSPVQDSSLGGFDPLFGSSVVQSNVAPSSESAFSFIGQPSQQVSTNQPGSNGSNGFGVASIGCAAPTENLNRPTIGQATESSAFSFISASPSSQPSCQVSFDPLASTGPPVLQQLQPPAQLGNFAPGYGTAPGMLPQQPMWAPGNYAHCQMNPCAQHWGGVLGHPSMPSCAVVNPMNLVFPQMGTGVGNPSLVGSNAGLATTTPQPSKPQQQSNQASSFDPFDPFAPGPISVCA